MLCISIAPESRTLAKADLLNAARFADLVELRLDRFRNEPDLPELLSGVDKPVLVCCPRASEGGGWQGADADRVALLQKALAATPAYVELDVETAPKVPRARGVQRVVSVHCPNVAASAISTLIDRAANAGADVVKLIWSASTVDHLWPVVSEFRRRRHPPIVGVVQGPACRTFAVLGPKLGCPWSYAALERGMESYEGQPTVQELEETYAWRDVTTSTELIGVLGFGRARTAAVRLLNAAFRQSSSPFRCLPLDVGDAAQLPQFLDHLQMRVLLSPGALGEHLLPLARQFEDAATQGANADLLLRKGDGWHAYNMLWRSALKVLTHSLRRLSRDDRPLKVQNVLVLGAGRTARSLVYGLRQLECTPIVASPSDDRDEILFCRECGSSVDIGYNPVHKLAIDLAARHVSSEELSSVVPDVVVIAEPTIHLGFGRTELNPALLSPPALVMDLSQLTQDGECAVEARLRGCQVVKPSYVFAEQLAAQFQAIAGRELPTEVFVEAIDLGR